MIIKLKTAWLKRVIHGFKQNPSNLFFFWWSLGFSIYDFTVRLPLFGFLMIFCAVVLAFFAYEVGDTIDG